jgi:hypothetical protein
VQYQALYFEWKVLIIRKALECILVKTRSGTSHFSSITAALYGLKGAAQAHQPLMIFLARYGPGDGRVKGYILAANLDHHRMEIFQKPVREGFTNAGLKKELKKGLKPAAKKK